jgi:hypothetical protein
LFKCVEFGFVGCCDGGELFAICPEAFVVGLFGAVADGFFSGVLDPFLEGRGLLGGAFDDVVTDVLGKFVTGVGDPFDDAFIVSEPARIKARFNQ